MGRTAATGRVARQAREPRVPAFSRRGAGASLTLSLLTLSTLLLSMAACSVDAPLAPPAPPATDAPSAPPARAPLQAPELATGESVKPGWIARRQAVAAAHPLAAQAGLDILRAGGSALDAAIATQLVLGLVEPQSSGLGGGAFLMHWDGRRVQAYDGRETAPAKVDERLFLDPAGRPLTLERAMVGGRSVGVPGAMRMLELAHRQHGRLPWARLFEPAIELAEGGFPIGARLHAQLAGDPSLRDDPRARRYFYAADGQPHPVGHRLRNPDYAAVLRDLVTQGARALHEGPIAARIAAAVQGHATNPGRLSAADLAGYAAREREPLCHPWRRYLVCGMPPPSSGALAVGQILGLLEQRARPGPADPAAPDAVWLHDYAEASRLAFADRAAWVGDPDFVSAPAGRWAALLDDDYLRQRAASIGPRAAPSVPPGRPAGASPAPVAAASPERPATSHLSIVDAQGRAVSMTTTIEAQFGSRLMVDSGRGLAGGFLLNNQLTDFSFTPEDAGRPVANRVQPGKRPRSSMSPTLVFEREGMRLVLVTGSPGGVPIIHYTARSILATLGWGLTPQAAVAGPNFGALEQPMLLEAGRFPPATATALRERGHTVVEVPLTSGTHLLRRMPDGSWQGGADPRREGVVAID